MSAPADAALEWELVALETRALERWCAGDPSGYLELYAADVSYFDPFQPRRVDGLPALVRIYEALRGKISADRFELLDPRLQRAGEGAVLTFDFVSHGAGGSQRWHCSEVYRRHPPGWRIVQSHWSVAPEPAGT